MSTYEAWRATHQDAEAAAKAAFEQVQGLAKMVDSLQGALGRQVRFGSVSDAAAAELRRLHAENQELKEQMAAIGAGGVEPLRKRAEAHDLAARQREMQLLGEIEALERVALNALKQLEETTHTTKNGMSGNWLTVVYRDIQPGDEARAIAEHPKASALSWSHALHERDAAIAAQAKQGGAHP